MWAIWGFLLSFYIYSLDSYFFESLYVALKASISFGPPLGPKKEEDDDGAGARLYGEMRNIEPKGEKRHCQIGNSGIMLFFFFFLFFFSLFFLFYWFFSSFLRPLYISFLRRRRPVLKVIKGYGRRATLPLCVTDVTRFSGRTLCDQFAINFHPFPVFRSAREI